MQLHYGPDAQRSGSCLSFLHRRGLNLKCVQVILCMGTSKHIDLSEPTQPSSQQGSILTQLLTLDSPVSDFGYEAHEWSAGVMAVFQWPSIASNDRRFVKKVPHRFGTYTRKRCQNMSLRRRIGSRRGPHAGPIANEQLRAIWKRLVRSAGLVSFLGIMG